jgi:hypothetical protein
MQAKSVVKPVTPVVNKVETNPFVGKYRRDDHPTTGFSLSADGASLATHRGKSSDQGKYTISNGVATIEWPRSKDEWRLTSKGFSCKVFRNGKYSATYTGTRVP